MNIPQEMRQIRAALNKSQQEMADLLGIKQQVYSNIENGRTKKFDQKILEFVQQNKVESKVESPKTDVSGHEKPTKLGSVKRENVVTETTTTTDMLYDLIESNKMLSKAMMDFAIANKNISENEVRLAKMLETSLNDPSSNHLAVESMKHNFLELLSTLRTKDGLYRTNEQGISELNKLFADIENHV